MIKKIGTYLLEKIRRLTTPRELLKNQILIKNKDTEKLEKSIKQHFHQGWRGKENYSSEAYQGDLKAHLSERLNSDRINYIPWFNKTIKLKGASVLEIGCGTGSSTVALAEQGALVTGIDIDSDAIEVAKDRCEIYNLHAKFIVGNASDVFSDLQYEKFDIIIFFASMEHMTHIERIDTLKKYYKLLREGAYLSIVDTPNRLWFYDSHTSYLPFFHWLPDNLAYEYSRYSNRNNFKELYHQYSDENFLHFLRRGRGFSYHELEIAFNTTVEKINVVDYLKRPFIPLSIESKYRRLLIRLNPQLSKGYFNTKIDIIIKK